MTDTPTPTPTDGRTARRDRNREAVLDAAIELFGEGDLTPSATSVAERSGVSLRSVYRYYEDLEELLRASIGRSLERNRPYFAIEGLGEGPLEERVDRLVEHRMALYEQVAGIARAAVLRARTNEIVRAQVERQMAGLRAQTEAMFAPELRALRGVERTDLSAALSLVTGLEAMEYLRVTLGRSPEISARIMGQMLHALLQAQPPA